MKCAAGVEVQFNGRCPKCGADRGEPCPEALAHEREAFRDMLAALQAVVGEWREGYGLKCAEQVRAAIAKAEGR